MRSLRMIVCEWELVNRIPSARAVEGEARTELADVALVVQQAGAEVA